jgi:hypothetical protein
VTLDGKTFVVEGDRPPSEDEARAAFQAYEPPKAQEQAPAPEERSVGGFLGNVASSGGRFIKDTVTGAADLAKFTGSRILSEIDPDRKVLQNMRDREMAEKAPEIASALGTAAKNRYGGMEQIKNTLYTDPVGIASDISTLLMPAKAGLKAGGFTKLAKAAGAVSEATNPMRALGAVVEPMTHGAAQTIVRGTLRPPAAVREDFGGAKGVANAVLKDRVFSEASAGQKLDTSVAKADQMLADAQAAGAAGVPRIDVARSVLGGPKDTAKLRTRLGVPDQTGDLTETAKAIYKNNPRDIALTDAQAMKREAQALAYEAGADNQTVKKAAEIAKAKALRSGIEAKVPAVGPVNERSQRLLGSKLAFGAAQDRPRALTNFLSLLGGAGGFASGGPIGAAAVPLLMKAMDSPRVGALTGIGINELGKGINAKSLRQAALMARLRGQE